MNDEKDKVEGFLVMTELQPAIEVNVHKLYNRYVEIMGCCPGRKIENYNDFLLSHICDGLGFPGVGFSDLINMALVKAIVDQAKKYDEVEKELGIT